MSKRNLEQMWVTKDFKKKIKKEAAEKGYPTIASYLDDLAKEENNIRNKVKRGLDFGF